MSLAPVPRASHAERITSLEHRTDAHDRLLGPMAEQLAEMYGAWTKATTIFKAVSWFWIKLGAFIGGSLLVIASLTTIWVNAGKLLGH